jgi:glycosyltransferase involved in cell wall biosynthesis
MSTITVVIASYQYGHLAAHCIESVLCQKTNFPFEIIIGEDGSKDNTAQVLIDYQNKFPDIIRVIFQDQSKKIFVEGKPTGI